MVQNFFADCWASPHLYIWETQIPSHATDLVTMNVISSNMFLQLFRFTTTYFSSLLLPLSQLFWDVLLSSNSRWANIFHAIVKCLAFNIWYAFYVLLGIKHLFMRFPNHSFYSVRTFSRTGVVNAFIIADDKWVKKVDYLEWVCSSPC